MVPEKSFNWTSMLSLIAKLLFLQSLLKKNQLAMNQAINQMAADFLEVSTNILQSGNNPLHIVKWYRTWKILPKLRIVETLL